MNQQEELPLLILWLIVFISIVEPPVVTNPYLLLLLTPVFTNPYQLLLLYAVVINCTVVTYRPSDGAFGSLYGLRLSLRPPPPNVLQFQITSTLRDFQVADATVPVIGVLPIMVSLPPLGGTGTGRLHSS